MEPGSLHSIGSYAHVRAKNPRSGKVKSPKGGMERTLPEKPVIVEDRNFQNTVVKIVQGLVERADALDKKTKSSMKKIRPELREMLELQLTSQRVGLESNLMVAAGEAVSSTVKRLQQMSGS